MALIKGMSYHQCDICGKKFGHLNDLKKHRRRFHKESKGEDPTTFDCTFCDQKFNFFEDLKSHVICYHEPKNDTYDPVTEGKLMKDIYVLNKSLKCKKCGKRFNHPKELR